MKKIMLTSLACLSLVACGFTPMYGTAFQDGQTDVMTSLSRVEIGNIPDYEGQFLRNALIDRFYRDGRPINPRYSLNISKIEESIVDLDITKDSDATRAQLRLSSYFILTDNETNQAVLERSVKAVSSFNVLTSEFATRVSEKNTRENALNDLARQIELQIGLYLQRAE